MAGITLAVAEAKLELWLVAETALASSQSYEIDTGTGRRQLTRVDLSEVRKTIDYWQGKVNALTAVTNGRRRTRLIVN